MITLGLVSIYDNHNIVKQTKRKEVFTRFSLKSVLYQVTYFRNELAL